MGLKMAKNSVVYPMERSEMLTGMFEKVSNS